MTHLDSVKHTDTISVITHYTDKTTKKESPYRPYQTEIDELIPHTVEFEGWDGNDVMQAKSPRALPLAPKRFLSFISQTIAPVLIGTHGADTENYLLFTN